MSLLRHPLYSMYSLLFGVSMAVVFMQLGGSIVVAFENPAAFGSLGDQLRIVTLAGAFFGFLHQWSAYRDLGHIGLSANSLEASLPFWINTRLEFVIRSLAIGLMLIAFSKGHVIVELFHMAMSFVGFAEVYSSPCKLVGGVCSSIEGADIRKEQALFLACGAALSIALLLWSLGAYVKSKNAVVAGFLIPEGELLKWVFTDFVAVCYWLLCALLVWRGAHWVALALSFFAVLLIFTIGIRFFILDRRASPPLASPLNPSQLPPVARKKRRRRR